MNCTAINIDKDIMGGTPVFNGTRVPIKNLFDYLETGDTIDDFIEDFESVNREQIRGVKSVKKSYREIFKHRK